jgi:hypothetical protein
VVRRVVAVRRGRRQHTEDGRIGGPLAAWHHARGEPKPAWGGDDRGDVVAS